jgi:protein-L-isoaspartate(D-aspartate) O-methyltransferase
VDVQMNGSNGSNGIGMTSDRTRMRMIDTLRLEGITDERVLNAMAEIPRHKFVDAGIASRAYEDVALPIGHGQTISSPTIVGLMTQLLLEVKPMDKVLEVGTGCGYQAAVLGKLVKEVYTLERIAPLMDKARRNLRDLRFYNIRYKHADGHGGYAEGAPYHGILIAASATHVPDALRQQLAVGGRMVLPVGIQDQWLYTVDRTTSGFVETKRMPVRFVPLLPGVA